MLEASALIIDIGIIIILATLIGYLARILKQPLIPAYIITGFILGPLVLGRISDFEVIKALSEIGIAFLLFIVGLEIDLRKLRNVGFVSFIAGLIQVIAVFALGYAAALFLGFSKLAAIYAGLVVAFSSTMVVIKLLSDRNQIDTLHGRLIIGLLIMQDVLVIFALSLLASVNQPSFTALFMAIFKGVILFGIVILFGKYVFPRLFKFSARSKELLF